MLKCCSLSLSTTDEENAVYGSEELKERCWYEPPPPERTTCMRNTHSHLKDSRSCPVFCAPWHICNTAILLQQCSLSAYWGDHNEQKEGEPFCTFVHWTREEVLQKYTYHSVIYCSIFYLYTRPIFTYFDFVRRISAWRMKCWGKGEKGQWQTAQINQILSKESCIRLDFVLSHW